MQSQELKKYLLDRLIECNKKLIKYETVNINWTDLKSESQNNLDIIKAGARILDILVYALLTITIIFSLIKIFGESILPDWHRGALLIFLTACNVLTVYFQKNKIRRLEKQILLLNILEKIDGENNI